MDQYFRKMAESLEAEQLAHGGREALQKEYGAVFEGPFLHAEKAHALAGFYRRSGRIDAKSRCLL